MIILLGNGFELFRTKKEFVVQSGDTIVLYKKCDNMGSLTAKILSVQHELSDDNDYYKIVHVEILEDDGFLHKEVDK